MPKPGRPRRPLPLRDGVDPVRIRLADPGQGPRSIPEELRRRFPDRLAELEAALASGQVVTADGEAVTDATRRHRGMDVWTYRTPEPEIEVPFEIEILHRDDRLVVVDKPHFLATTPRAGHITQTALVRLRRDLGLEDLAPVHRLDRLTAGVLVFTVDPAHRAAYQDLFAARRVDKTYLAVAPAPDGTPRVRERSSRIVKTRGVLQAAEVDGQPDAHTRITLVATHDPEPGRGESGTPLGLYRLEPTTGRTHQLRVHMNALGSPILGDDLYPRVRTIEPGDFSGPLQLLAESIGFTDPISGDAREFTTRRTLESWPWGRAQGENPGNPPSAPATKSCML
ncbi:pseudouridine synthase [Dietzia sp. PP-33]|jgi:tRNA pseudouridine32 synthase/23S rRNA pseudouridine746 synthase|uniref:pseudouridine synthase n=1 Tax=Dietzia sp. PP-33 TaxID=2957500 RepID=UPI0029AB22D8|nr:pseudouridine synthase [Dietzia sp. PP-33]MDX2356295.1 pseudouridine synthase [Dietzia sp. PP-33]